MTDLPASRRELLDKIHSAVIAQMNGELTPEQFAAFDRLLAESGPARQLYVEYVYETLALPLMLVMEDEEHVPPSFAKFEIESAEPPIIPAFLSVTRDGTAGYFASGWPVAYLVATVIFGIGLVVGGLLHVTQPTQLATQSPSVRKSQPSPAPETQCVGRITEMADCRWGDPKNETSDRAPVRLGSKYVLEAGFMEISYDTGAKVILQGPAAYEVESATGGFLSLGKLTARVEGRETRVESGEKSVVGGRSPVADKSYRELAAGSRLNENTSPSPLSPLPSPLFCVRTPTAVVTDLGTEFGVEVDRSGASRAYVFRGKIELRPTDDAGAGKGPAIPLDENEWATVESGRQRAAKVTHGAGQAVAQRFVRRMPRWAPIEVFGTGVGLPHDGDRDPHWQIVAWSGDRAKVLKPQAAVVNGWVRDAYLAADDRNRAQWITIPSPSANLPGLPEGTYTFRTTFKLRDVLPESAVLTGRFIADNHVDAIRLNGRAMPVPEHRSTAPFIEFHPFRIEKGFVQGTNVLEIDVYNSLTEKGGPTPMALRVELEGFALRQADGPAANVREKERPPMKQ